MGHLGGDNLQIFESGLFQIWMKLESKEAPNFHALERGARNAGVKSISARSIDRN